MNKNHNHKFDIKGWHIAILYPLTILSIVGSLVLLTINIDSNWVDIASYIVFCIAALCLGLSIYTFVKFGPTIAKNIEKWLRKNAFIDRLFAHYDFRTIVFNTINFIINIGYVVFNAIIGVVSKSVWYGSLAAYYLILTIMRGVIVMYHAKNALLKIKRPAEYESMSDKQVELRLYRLNGVLLILLPIALSFVILDMVQNGSAFVKWGWTVFGFAAIAFYKVIASIVQIVKSRKKSEDYTIYGLRNIGFAAALVTILSLQTSLLHSFGSTDFNSAYANAATGAGVCAVTAIMGAIMIIGSSKKIKLLNIEEKEHQNTNEQ